MKRGFPFLVSFVLACLIVMSNAQDVGGSVTFRGLKTFTESEARDLIKRQLDYIDKNGASAARADDAAYFLQRDMRERGYEDARVTWEMPTLRRILLNVSEGRLLVLSGVRSSGNHALNDEALFELMTADTRDRLKLKLEDEIPYVVKDVEAGRRHVKEFYELLGYVAATVTLSTPEIDPNPPGNRAAVRLIIDEGVIYKLGNIQLGPPPDPSLEGAFNKVLEDYATESFSPSIASQVAARVQKIAKDAGYFDAEVKVIAQDPTYSGDHNSVDLVATADYGKKFLVKEIELKGNELVEDRYFRRSFDDLVGEPYNPDEASDIVARMLKTGAFTRVTAAPTVLDAEAGLLQLDVEVEEAKSRSLGVFGGFGSWEGPIVGFDYVNRNFLQTAKRFDTLLEFSQRGIEGEMTYTDPQFRWTEWEASIGLFSRTRFNEGYDKFEVGLLATVSREFDDKHTVTLFGQASLVEVYEFEVEKQFVGDTSYIDTFLGVSYELDWRDDETAPRRGGYLHASNSIASTALGGEFTYFRSAFEFNYHIPLGRATLHLGADIRGILPLGGESLLPIDLRLFSGGPRGVRSLPERELGVLDAGGYPIGGEFTSVFKIEYEIPVVGPLHLAVFADAGNVLTDFSDAGFDEMHYAAGAGIRLHSPLGPLRIDYGHNLNRRDREPSGTLHIGFGSAF